MAKAPEKPIPPETESKNGIAPPIAHATSITTRHSDSYGMTVTFHPEIRMGSMNDEDVCFQLAGEGESIFRFPSLP
jgi:hypothetical protein